MPPPPTPNPTYLPGTSSLPPTSLNQPAFFILFALLAAAMVLGVIWFFFIAKNGGFVWKEGDWEDYKSTVLRRTGPDGRTLTSASRSTRLGRGSKWGRSEKGDEEKSLWAGEGGYADEMGAEKRGRHGRRHHGEGGGKDGMDEELLAYRAEVPARVGGLNGAPSGHGSQFGGSRSAYSKVRGHSQPSSPSPRKSSGAKKAASRPQAAVSGKRKTLFAKHREAKAFKTASTQAKHDIAHARKEREEYLNLNYLATRQHHRTSSAPAAPPPPHIRHSRRNSLDTQGTSTIFTVSEVSDNSDMKKSKEGSYYATYRPVKPTSHSRSREASRSRGPGREAGGGKGRSRSTSRTRHSQHSTSPTKSHRSKFPPSSYNGSDLTSVTTPSRGTRAPSQSPVRGLRTSTREGNDGAKGSKQGGYVNRFKDSLSDSDSDSSDDGRSRDLGAGIGGYHGAGRKW